MRTLLKPSASGGRIITAPGTYLAAGGTTLYADRFLRSDRRLDRGWIDGGDEYPDGYGELHIKSNAVTIDPSTGEADPAWGIGCAWRECHTADVTVTVRSIQDVTGIDGPHSIEVAPLLHIVPGTVTHGVGAWLSYLTAPWNAGSILIGTIGNPASAFDVFGSCSWDFDTGPHTLSMTSQAGNITNVTLDGVSLQLRDFPAANNVSSLPVPAAHVGSTLHGFAVDTHLMDPPSVTQPILDGIWITPA